MRYLVLIFTLLFSYMVNAEELSIYEAVKLTNTAYGLERATEAAESYDEYLKSSKTLIKSLSGKIENLESLINNQKLGRFINLGKTSQQGRKAVATMTKNIENLELNRIQTMGKIKDIEAKVLRVKVSGNLPNSGKQLSKLKTVGKYAGPALLVVDLASDAQQLGKRVNEGSSVTLELLTAGLKVTESLIPSIPLFKNPSDVAREMINLSIALKNKNKSLLTSNNIILEEMTSFNSGEASIESYMIRKSQDPNFQNRINKIGVKQAYLEARKDYMKSFASFLKSVSETRKFLTVEKGKAWLKDSKSLYTSLLNGVDIAESTLLNKQATIWNTNAGLDIATAINDVYVTQKDLSNSIKEVTLKKETFDNELSSVSKDVQTLSNDLKKSIAQQSNQEKKRIQEEQSLALLKEKESDKLEKDKILTAKENIRQKLIEKQRLAAKEKIKLQLIERQKSRDLLNNEKLEKDKLLAAKENIRLKLIEKQRLTAKERIRQKLIERQKQRDLLNETCYVCDNSLSRTITSINQGNNSTIGSASQYTGIDSSIVISKANIDKVEQLTGLQQAAVAQNTTNLESTDWVLISGDESQHLQTGSTFGSISIGDEVTITSLNNSGVQETSMQKTVSIPVGIRQVTVGMVANFVTNEFPDYVGSQYNDSALIEIKTGSGNIYQATLFNKELNTANFNAVTNLPSPLSPTGGETGFEKLNKVIPVANGGDLTVTVTTTNVGDTAVPSATLVYGTSVK